MKKKSRKQSARHQEETAARKTVKEYDARIRRIKALVTHSIDGSPLKRFRPTGRYTIVTPDSVQIGFWVSSWCLPKGIRAGQVFRVMAVEGAVSLQEPGHPGWMEPPGFMLRRLPRKSYKILNPSATARTL